MSGTMTGSVVVGESVGESVAALSVPEGAPGPQAAHDSTRTVRARTSGAVRVVETVVVEEVMVRSSHTCFLLCFPTDAARP